MVGASACVRLAVSSDYAEINIRSLYINCGAPVGGLIRRAFVCCVFFLFFCSNERNETNTGVDHSWSKEIIRNRKERKSNLIYIITNVGQEW